MLAVLGLLTGWVLLLPLLLVLFISAGGRPPTWLFPIWQISGSVPVLGFCTLAGVFLIVTSVRKLARSNRREPGPY